MDDLQFCVLFNSISVILGQWEGDNERLCAMESIIGWKDFPQWESNPGPLGQQARVNPLSYRISLKRKKEV